MSDVKNPGKMMLHPRVSWARRKWNRIVQLWRLKFPKEPEAPVFELGNTMALSHDLFKGFRAILEERTGFRIERLHCHHCNDNQHARLAYLSFGIVCLDCLMMDLNKRYPK